MPKYEHLHTFLASLPGRSWTATFREIEKILGFALPPSALKYPAWWANDRTGHSHAGSWLDAGWHASAVDIGRRSVTFTRTRQVGGVRKRKQTNASDTADRAPSVRKIAANCLRPGRTRGEPEYSTTVALVSCGKRKVGGQAMAADMYLSPRFKYARAIPERKGWRWYVLSAKYGLVPPDQIIDPYDQTLVGASKGIKRNWADKVLHQIRSTLESGVHIVLLAGHDYTEFLAGPLREAGFAVDEPLDGLRQGEQLSRLKQMAAEGQLASRPERASPEANLVNAVAERIHIDVGRAREVAEKLHAAFAPGGPGVFGERGMPEDLLPEGVSEGSREHLNFLTLTISVDYLRDAVRLWQSARIAWNNESTRYLFDPAAVVRTGLEQVKKDLTNVGIALRPTRDSKAWFGIGRTLACKWNSDVKKFLADCSFHGPTILARISHDGEVSSSGWTFDFPLLRGPKIGSLWVRTLRDNALLELTGLEDVPIPVDVHVMRATLCSGAIRGRYSGSLEQLKRTVRDVWRLATEDCHHADGRPMIALDIDEPLWTLSRLGCSQRGNGLLARCPSGCALAPGCVEGRIRITNSGCEFDVHF